MVPQALCSRCNGDDKFGPTTRRLQFIEVGSTQNRQRCCLAKLLAKFWPFGFDFAISFSAKFSLRINR